MLNPTHNKTIMTTILSVALALTAACGDSSSTNSSTNTNVELRNTAWSGNLNSSTAGNLETYTAVLSDSTYVNMVFLTSISISFAQITIDGDSLNSESDQCTVLFTISTATTSCTFSASNINETHISGRYTLGDNITSGTYSLTAGSQAITTSTIQARWVGASSSSITVTDNTAQFTYPDETCTGTGSIDTERSTDYLLVYTLNAGGCDNEEYNGMWTIALGHTTAIFDFRPKP